MKLKLLLCLTVLALAFAIQPVNAQKRGWSRYEKQEHRNNFRDSRHDHYRDHNQGTYRRYHRDYSSYGYYKKMPPGQVKKYYRNRYSYSGNRYYTNRIYPYPQKNVVTIAIGVPVGF